VFGIVDGEEAHLLRPLARALQARGSLVPTEHGGLALGHDAKAVLTGAAAVLIALAPKREKTRKARRGAAAGVNPTSDPLFDALRELRRERAAEAGVPPYVVFHDSTLREMAARRPQSLADLGEITGVGARKLEAHGDAFLAVIRQF
jgi:ATP-dependent DNA helicase RecQ